MDPIADAPAQDNPPVADGTTPDPAIAQSNSDAGTTPATPDYSNLLGDENFDPSTLPAELQPAYNQLRADYTRKTQTVAAQRQEAEDALAFISALNTEGEREAALSQLAEALGPEAILSALGYELDNEDSGIPESGGAPAPSDPRIDQIMQHLEAQDSEAQEAALISQIQDYAENEFTRLGIEKDDEDMKELILGRAAVYDLDADGLPQIEAAAKDVARLLSKQRGAFFERKENAPGAPLSGSVGQEDDFDFSDPDARAQAIARVMQGQT